MYYSLFVIHYSLFIKMLVNRKIRYGLNLRSKPNKPSGTVRLSEQGAEKNGMRTYLDDFKI